MYVNISAAKYKIERQPKVIQIRCWRLAKAVRFIRLKGDKRRFLSHKIAFFLALQVYEGL